MKYDECKNYQPKRLPWRERLIFGVVVGTLAAFAPSAFGQTSGSASIAPPIGGWNGKMITRRNPEWLRRQKGYSLLVKEAHNFQKEGKLDEARHKFEAIPQNYDEAPTAYMYAREGLAEIYTQRGQWGKAIQEYQRRLDPELHITSSNDVEIRCKFVLVLCNAERFDEALANYSIAHEILSGFDIVRAGLPLPATAETLKSQHELISKKTHLLLAANYLINTDYPKVESEAALGSELGDDNRLSHLYTGLALADLGRDRREQAQRELETATAGDADPKIKQAAVKTLERLVKAKSPA